MKKFYPVIHAETFSQALENVNIAFDAGADGVFLINHTIDSGRLLHLHSAVSSAFPDSFPIGINCLDFTPFELIFEIDNSIPMIWVDNCLVDENLTEQKEAAAVREAIEKTNWRGQYFGGTAFKYQKEVKDLELVTKLAANYVDVVTTSGPATGSAASPEKIRRMKAALGDQSLAIASGITSENVLDYLPFVDIFLVASGISDSFEQLNAEKTEELAKKIHGFNTDSNIVI